MPSVLLLKPDYPESRDDRPFFWGENEYLVPEGAMYFSFANANARLAHRAK